MGFMAIATIALVALAVGAAVQLAEKKTGYSWLLVAVTGTFGAYFASETFPGTTVFEAIKNWGPQYDGFYVIPGIITGAALALVAYFGSRTLQTTTAAA